MRKTKSSLYIIAATAITVATLFMLPFTPKTAVPMAVVSMGDLALTTRMEGLVCRSDEQPCVALCGGRVEAVCVGKGDAVSAGALLFALDSGYEQRAIASLSQAVYEQEAALMSAPYGEAVAAACAQSLLEARVKLSELSLSAEAKRVRAQKDGTVGGVYVREGDYIAEGTVLGLVYSDGLQISAACRAADVTDATPGAVAAIYDASGRRLGLATLALAGMPVIDGAAAQAVQTLRFAPEGEDVLAATKPGDTVVVELLNAAYPDSALAPISAVGEGDTLWLASDGRAAPVRIDVGRRNADYVCVPDKYIGASVILTPDAYDLYPGCPVKELKRK